MKHFLLAFAFLPFCLSAQRDTANQRPRSGYNNSPEDSTQTTHKKLLKVVSLSVYLGGDFYRDGFEDRTIFQQAAPQSTVAFTDLSGYSNSPGSFYNIVGKTAVTKGVNIQFHMRGTPRYSEFRTGFFHTSGTVATQYYYKESTTLIDTISMSNGDVLYVDSLSSSILRYDWYTDAVHLNVGWIVRSDPRRVFNFYTGLGVNAGISYNGVIETEQVHHTYHHTYSDHPMSNISYTTNRNTEVIASERFKAPGISSFSVYVPIGYNLRLSRKNSVLSHMTIYGEYVGAIQFLYPKGTNSKTRTASTMVVGVRWYVHAPKQISRDDKRRSVKHRDDYRKVD